MVWWCGGEEREEEGREGEVVVVVPTIEVAPSRAYEATNNWPVTLGSQTPGRLRQPRHALMAGLQKDRWTYGEGHLNSESESISMQHCVQKSQKHSELRQGKNPLIERRVSQDRTRPRRWHPTWAGRMPSLPPREKRESHKRQISQLISAK